MGSFQLPPSPPATSVLPPRLNETLHHFMASMTVTKGVISTNPLGVAGRATCRPFGDGLVSTHPIPFGNISLTAKTERNTSPFHGLHDGDKGGGFNPHPFAWQAEPWLLAVSRVSMMTLVRTAFLTCASQAPLRSAHFVTMLHVTCYNKVVPYCAGWAYRKYIVYIIYILYILYIFYTPQIQDSERRCGHTEGAYCNM